MRLEIGMSSGGCWEAWVGSENQTASRWHRSLACGRQPTAPGGPYFGASASEAISARHVEIVSACGLPTALASSRGPLTKMNPLVAGISMPRASSPGWGAKSQLKRWGIASESSSLAASYRAQVVLETAMALPGFLLAG